MREWVPVRDRADEVAESVYRPVCVVAWLIVLYLVLSIVSMVDDHYTRRMDALRRPVPARTER